MHLEIKHQTAFYINLNRILWNILMDLTSSRIWSVVILRTRLIRTSAANQTRYSGARLLGWSVILAIILHIALHGIAFSTVGIQTGELFVYAVILDGILDGIGGTRRFGCIDRLGWVAEWRVVQSRIQITEQRKNGPWISCGVVGSVRVAHGSIDSAGADVVGLQRFVELGKVSSLCRIAQVKNQFLVSGFAGFQLHSFVQVGRISSRIHGLGGIQLLQYRGKHK